MKFTLSDKLICAGLCSLLGGLWWIYPPLALIVFGVLLLSAAVVAKKAAVATKQ